MKKLFIRGDMLDTNILAVKFIHHDPLNEVDGLTEKQLGEGYLVDSIPEPTDCPTGKVPSLRFNVETKELFYDYSMDAPPPRPTLDSVNAKLDLIMQSMLESEGIL